MHQHPTFGRVVFIRLKPTGFGHVLVIHNNLANRMLLAAMDQSSFCPISFDGSVLDYHGFNG
jgi:hypothetical protein